MNEESKSKPKPEKHKLEIRDESGNSDIRDEELDRVSGGGNNSVWGTGQPGNGSVTAGP
ncbi:MAG TPA: hypothetical protein VKR56_05260 [Candidatus Cybelea sp.]|jgi:hypothetical protein|nr:hypothetical protein [Candidatus Cybelea sp.]